MQLKTILKDYCSYTLTARGPLAAWVALQSMTPACISFTVQARGLLAEEHLYTQQHQRGIIYLIHRLRAWQLQRIEHSVYSRASIHIEAVSPALKTFLIDHYTAQPQNVSIAQQDIPACIPVKQCQEWLVATRTELAIPQESVVYCYNGSVKAWQCPEMVISFFKKKLISNSASFLLIITQDKEEFARRIKAEQIPHNSYTIISIPHQEVYRYLAACNVGLIFREPHIINWVSRPTKILEYQAVGLEITHNNTIEWLQNQCSNHS